MFQNLSPRIPETRKKPTHPLHAYNTNTSPELNEWQKKKNPPRCYAQPLDPLPNPLSVFAEAVILLDAVGCCAVGFTLSDVGFEGLCVGAAVSPLPSKPQIPQKDLRQSEQTDPGLLG